MRNMTEAEKNKWLENGAKEVTISFSDGTAPITNEDIVQESMHIDKTLSDESNIKYGKCSASCFRITIFATDTSYVGKKISVDISTDNSTLLFGQYTVYSEERTSNKMQKILTAYDDMYRIANTDVAEWYNGLTFPISMKQFRGAFFNYFDIQEVPINLLFDNMSLEKTIYAEQISGLDIIQSICEINACFGQINNEGRFEYVTLDKPSVYTDDNTFYPSEYHMNGLNYEDYVTQPITKVVIRQSSDDVGGSYGEEGNVLAIENNLFVYGKDTEELIEMSRLIYDRVKDKGYNPSSLVMDFQPHLELGDFIKVITPNNEEIEFPILYRSIKGIVALKDEVRASGERTYATITNSIEKKVVQLQGKYNKITTNVDEFKVEVGATYQKKSDMSDYATVERTSNLEQTVEGITSDVSETIKAVSAQGEQIIQNTSQIQQNANNIALKVDSNGVINAINVSSEGVGINASKVDVNGVVNIINDGSTTLIDGGHINTDSLTAKKVEVKDGDNIVFYANGVGENKDVKIGGFAVTKDNISYTGDFGSGNVNTMNIGHTGINMNSMLGDLGGYIELDGGGLKTHGAHNINVVEVKGDEIDLTTTMLGQVRASTSLSPTSFNLNDKVKMWTDTEGGNFEISSPNDSRKLQMDIYDNSHFRMYLWYPNGNWDSSGDDRAYRNDIQLTDDVFSTSRAFAVGGESYFNSNVHLQGNCQFIYGRSGGIFAEDGNVWIKHPSSGYDNWLTEILKTSPRIDGTKATTIGNIMASGYENNQINYIRTNGSSTPYTLNVNARWGNGTIATHNIVSSSSDIRLKDNIADTTVENALEVINQIKMREFDWKENGEHQKIGFIADELQEIDQKLAFGGEDEPDGCPNYKSVDTFYLIGYLTKAVQELSAEVKSLKAEIELNK